MIIYFVNDPERRVNYTGHFINGTRHGTGQTVWSNGQIYVGGSTIQVTSLMAHGTVLDRL